MMDKGTGMDSQSDPGAGSAQQPPPAGGTAGRKAGGCYGKAGA